MTGAETQTRVFIDTNIVLRAIHEDVQLHSEAEHLLTELRRTGHQLWISRQIIREYMVQVTRPGFLSKPLTAQEVENQLSNLKLAFKIADETEAVTTQLVQLLKMFPSGGKQIHDANIIATMLTYHIDTLLTLNIEDLKRFEPVVKLMTITSENT